MFNLTALAALLARRTLATRQSRAHANSTGQAATLTGERLSVHTRLYRRDGVQAAVRLRAGIAVSPSPLLVPHKRARWQTLVHA